jgi:hypothetical protein
VCEMTLKILKLSGLSSNKYLLSAYCGLWTLLGAENIKMNTVWYFCPLLHHHIGTDNINYINKLSTS